jgi:uncharacterized membrane protein
MKCLFSLPPLALFIASVSKAAVACVIKQQAYRKQTVYLIGAGTYAIFLSSV